MHALMFIETILYTRRVVRAEIDNVIVNQSRANNMGQGWRWKGIEFLIADRGHSIGGPVV